MTEELRIGVELRAFNATIRNRRLELGFTQLQLARRARVSVTVVSHLETFRNTRMTPSADKVLRVLGLDESASPEWLDALELHGKHTIERSISAESLPWSQLRGLPVGAQPGDEDGLDPLEQITSRVLDPVQHDALMEAVALLTEREQFILAHRYGSGDFEPWSLDRIADALDLTRERVRQLQAQALSKLAHLKELQKVVQR